MGSPNVSSMNATSTAGPPKRRARSSSSRSTAGGSSTTAGSRSMPFVLAQEIVERLTQQDRFLLHLALGERAKASELRDRVVGRAQHHVVAGGEAHRVAALLLGRVEGQIRFAHELLGLLRVARRVGDP